MSDQGFDFGPPPPKREARQFEPPPWERDQFERRWRDQEEAEAAAQEARAKVLAEEDAVREAELAAAAAAPDSALDGQAQPPAPALKAEVDEKQVAMMMLGLRAEEPPALEGAWAVSMIAGGVIALIGLASGIWGLTALSRRGLPAAGTIGGVVLLGLGLGFLGIGGWLIFKALRQRGVL